MLNFKVNWICAIITLAYLNRAVTSRETMPMPLQLHTCLKHAITYPFHVFIKKFGPNCPHLQPPTSILFLPHLRLPSGRRAAASTPTTWLPGCCGHPTRGAPPGRAMGGHPLAWRQFPLSSTRHMGGDSGQGRRRSHGTGTKGKRQVSEAPARRAR